MFERRIPEWLRHAPVPGVRGFAIISGAEAAARGLLISVMPIAMYRALEDPESVSEIYFLVGIASLLMGLLVPMLVRLVPRRFVFTFGACLIILGPLLASRGGPILVPVGLALITLAVVIMFVCFNAYVMDYIKRSELGTCETMRLYYSAASWAIGPFLGIWLMDQWYPLPFLLSALAGVILLIIFWYLRLSDSKQITAALQHAPNPIAYLPRFLAQPRLVAGWLFAVLRSCGWWVYVVYLPIFAVESGYSDQLGGIMLSLTNSLLFVTPLMLRWMRRRSVRIAVRTGFAGGFLCFAIAAVGADAPPVALIALFVGSGFLILLDVSAGLPYLMAVRPHERTEMSAVYSSYRDVSGILTPGIARGILAFGPLPWVFAAAALGLAACFVIAGRIHPRLGQPRAAPAGLSPVEPA